MDFGEAFVMWRGLGVNYEYGVLEHPARTAIHVTHRIGALVTFLYLGWLAISLLRRERALAGAALLVGTLLIAQVSLGIANVLLHLPLGVATAHNAVAALLLLSLVNLNFRLWPQRP
jgi:cytochrome c oxidase assembly protein subunit 15